MEALVGRAVRKAFPGVGTYAGVVESYDTDAGYFRVLYENSDSEEVDADEMAEILVGPSMPEALQRTPPPGDCVVLAVPATSGSSDGEAEPATPAALPLLHPAAASLPLLHLAASLRA